MTMLGELRRLLAALLALAATSCAMPDEPGVTPAAIVGGEASDDVAVVAIATRAAGCGAPVQVVCSGAVIAPRAVLTAAHCFEDRRPGVVYVVITGADVGAPTATEHRVADVFAHPEFDAATNAADLAVLIVDPPIDAAPLILARASVDASIVGTDAISIGYGALAGGEAPSGVRQRGVVRVAALEGTDHLRLEPGPAMSCRGDSGGPILLGGELLAVTAAGDPACAEYGLGVRLDLHAAMVDLAVDEASRWAPVAPRLTRDQLCEEPCEDDGECPDGTICAPTAAGPRCTAGTSPPGDLGALCEADAECESGTCVGVTGGCRCLEACSATPPPPPPEGGGCSVLPGSGAAPAALLVLLGMFTISTLCRRVFKS